MKTEENKKAVTPDTTKAIIKHCFGYSNNENRQKTGGFMLKQRSALFFAPEKRNGGYGCRKLQKTPYKNTQPKTLSD